MLQALIFDVDGTLANTEDAHRAAFNQAFAQAGLCWHWDEARYIGLLEISGGKERILHYWSQVQPNLGGLDGADVQALVNRLHALKTLAYERAVQDGSVPLRAGVLPLLQAARSQGVQLAIATTTSTANIGALLQATIGADWQQYFTVVEDASTAPVKKPHPQVYLQALQRLGLPASDCVAFEDSANGLTAARAADLATVVTPNRFTEHHLFEGALRLLPSLEGVTLELLHTWLEGQAAMA
ncbi:MAG: HAD-IA family hydrolase [Rhodoferax sp.]|nr:HAD-IA family hydrolase [Rhodoferax sp.]